MINIYIEDTLGYSMNQEEIESNVRREFKKTMMRMNNKDLSTVRNNPELKEEIIQGRIKEAMNNA